MPELDQMEPWCMVHSLYKCYCKNLSTEGKRFEFSDAKIDEAADELMTVSRRRQYYKTADELLEPLKKTK